MIIMKHKKLPANFKKDEGLSKGEIFEMYVMVGALVVMSAAAFSLISAVVTN